MPRLLRAAGAAVIVLALTGCVAPEPRVTPVPEPSVTPLFASDEEALAAAEAAYREYTAVEDAVARDGGTGAERLAPLVTPEWLEHETEAFDRFKETGMHQVGSTAVTGTTLQRWGPLDAETAEVVIYACVDFSATSFVDAVGATRESAGPRATTIEVTFQASSSDHLLLSASEPWPTSAC